MKYTYVLRIDCGIDKITRLNNLLKINNESTGNYYWEKILVEEASDTPVRFVAIFLSILEGKYEKLSLIGIQKEDISVWIYYEYEGQCNMYLTPEDMKQLGENGITLCISCWESLTETPQS